MSNKLVSEAIIYIKVRAVSGHEPKWIALATFTPEFEEDLPKGHYEIGFGLSAAAAVTQAVRLLHHKTDMAEYYGHFIYETQDENLNTIYGAFRPNGNLIGYYETREKAEERCIHAQIAALRKQAVDLETRLPLKSESAFPHLYPTPEESH